MFDFSIAIPAHDRGENGPKWMKELLDSLKVQTCQNFNVIVSVKGGGLSGQAGAIKLAISKALIIVLNLKSTKTSNILRNVSSTGSPSTSASIFALKLL